jgi:hypothetical protein
MCLVIDTCCLARVFDPENKEHPQFKPILKWVRSGNGRMIYGGTKYNNELRKATKYLGIVIELAKQQRVVRMPDEDVDRIADALKVKFPEGDFDDEHIVALVLASRCRVVCTNDNGAIARLKCKEIFSSYGLKRPKIYRSASHKTLCHDGYLVAVCRNK